MLLISALKRILYLHRFRWYRVPRPVLKALSGALSHEWAVRELDVLGGPVNEFEIAPIAVSKPNWRQDNDLMPSNYKHPFAASLTIPQYIKLDQMLLNNCTDLEVLFAVSMLLLLLFPIFSSFIHCLFH